MTKLPVSTPVAIALAAAATALGLALAVPVLVDGNAWRGRIESESSALLGRKVSVAGPITIRLLPSPSVSLAAVAVEDAASLDRVRLGLPLKALLAGQPRLSDISVEGGRIGPLSHLSLHAALAAESFTLGGEGDLGGRRLTLSANGSRASADAPMALHAAMALPGQEGAAEFGGSLGRDHTLEGKLELSLASLGRSLGPGRLPDLPLSGEARIKVSPDEISVPDLGILLGESTITGSIVAARDGAPALMDVTMRADAIDLDAWSAPPPPAPEAKAAPATPVATAPSPVSAPAPAPAAAQPFELPLGLTANLDLGLGRLTRHGEQATGLRLNALLEGGRLTLAQAAARLPGGGSVTLSGTLTTPEAHPRFDGKVKADSRDLPALRRWLGLGHAPAPAAARLDSRVVLADGRISLQALTLELDQRRITGLLSAGLALPVPIRAELGMSGLAFDFDGIVGLGQLDGKASLRAAGFAQAIRAFSPGYRPRGNGELFATGHLSGNDTGWALDGFQARAGEAGFSGTAQLSLEPKPRLTATLSGNAVALDPFLPTEAVKAAEKPAKADKPAHRAANTPPPAPRAAAPALDMGWMRTLDADLTLDAKAVSLGAWRLEQPRAHLAVTDGVATLDRLAGKLLGGDLAAAARLAPNAVSLSATLAGADLAALKPAAGGMTLEKGILGGDVRLTAAGTSRDALLASLGGDGRLAVTDGTVAGFDLAAMDRQTRHLENLGSLFSLLQTGLSGGTSSFSKLSGSFTADRGVVVSRDLALVAEGGGATGTATVNLPKETIAARIAFKLDNPDAPPLGLRLDGPLASPVKAIDINEIQRWLLAKGMGKALKGQGGTSESGSAPRKVKAGDVLRGLFSAFGKK